MRVLPFFVYGTLLPEQPNYALWEYAIVARQSATFSDGLLFDFGAYPMLVEGGGKPVKGALVTINSSDYENIVRNLDTLEGFDAARPSECVYRRLVRKINLPSGIRQSAWVYLGRTEFVTRAKLIESGDWVAHSAIASDDIAAWWEAREQGSVFGDSE